MSDIKGTLNKNIPVKEYAKKIDRGFMWLFSLEKLKLYIFLTLVLTALAPLYTFIFKLFTPEDIYFYPNVFDRIIAVSITLGCIMLYVSIRRLIKEKPEMKKLIREHIPQILFFFFAAYMFISCMIRGFSFWDWHNHGELLHENMLTYITYALYFTVCVSSIDKQRMKRLLIDIYIGVMTLLALVTFYAEFVSDITQFKHNEGIANVFNQFNYYAYFLNMGILLCAVMLIRSKTKTERAVYSISYLLNVFLLIINETFGCYLAALSGLIFLVIVSSIVDKKFNKKALVVLAVYIGITLLLTIWIDTVFTSFIDLSRDVKSIASNDADAGNAGTGRWELWMETIDMIKEKPVIGFGVSKFSIRMMHDLNTNIVRTHNEILQYAGWFGIPAAVFYAAGVLSVYLKGLKYRAHIDNATLACLTAAFGYFVSSMFGLTLFSTAPFFFMFLGLGLAINTNKQEEKPAEEKTEQTAAEAVSEKKEA